MVVAVTVGVVCWLFGLPLGLDNLVYRAGAVAVWHGQSPYGQLPDGCPIMPGGKK